MALKRKPWIKWYWTDWRGDEALRTCSYAARGLWADMLALMHQGDPYGHLSINGRALDAKKLASSTGGSLRDVERLLAELSLAGVFSLDENKTIFSRRMVRDKAKEDFDAANGRLGGNPNITKQDNVGVNPQDNGEDKAQRLEARDQKETPPPPSGASPLPKTRGTRLQFETIPDDWRAFAVSEGHPAPDAEFQKLKDWCASATGAKAVKVDWLAFWRNWIRKSLDDLRKQRGNGAPIGTDHVAARRADIMAGLTRGVGTGHGPAGVDDA